VLSAAAPAAAPNTAPLRTAVAKNADSASFPNAALELGRVCGKFKTNPQIAITAWHRVTYAFMEQTIINPANRVDKCQEFAQVLCYCPDMSSVFQAG
jgi:hypothetical protein